MAGNPRDAAMRVRERWRFPLSPRLFRQIALSGLLPDSSRAIPLLKAHVEFKLLILAGISSFGPRGTAI